jgi:Fic family protein
VSIKPAFKNMINTESVGWRPDRPHNQLPPLPPTQELENRAILKACITARAALADYRLLLAVTKDHDWETWILFMLKAVEETSRWTTAKIGGIRALAEHTTAHVRQRLPKIYSRELVYVIFEQPYCRISDLVTKEVAKRQAASRYLKELAAIGVLREVAVGKEKLFIHPKLMQLLSWDGNEFVTYGRA